ncbi:hypothetical protein IAR50_000488 [Cryptococcus sp. DSM 104548]
MSTAQYRRGGRFATANGGENQQRQLSLPVNKWKREWVAPEGLPAESSYKVFKWVKTDVKAQFGNETAYEVRDDTPVQEDDEGDEGEGQENDDDEDGGHDDDEDGEHGNVEESQGQTEGQAFQGEAAAAAQPGDEGEALKDTEPTALPGTLSTAETTDPQTALAPSPASAPQSSSTAEPTHEAPIPPHHEIPSNAVEITNSIPGDSAELGQGDLGLQGGVVAERRHEEDGDVEMEGVKEVGTEAEKEKESGDSMEVDEPSTLAEKEETPLEKDEGLVMGEMEPPVPEITVEGEDKPTEVEKESELP